MSRISAGSRAVVTGAGSGFGRAIALALAERGARLLLSDIAEEGLAETRAMVEARGAEVDTMKVDVRDAEQVGAMADRAKERWGGTDVLVNNAGVAVAGPIGDIPLEDWRWQIEINLMGVVYGCHHFVPQMKAQRHGFVLNVASLAGIASAPRMGPYNVTKAGVIALSETLYTELAPFDVRVTALCPSFFRTNIHKGTRSTGLPGDQTEKLVTQAKWSAEQVAHVALRGLERGELYVLPQGDARALWRAKRALGASLYGALGVAAKRGLLDRVLGGDAR